MGEHSGERDAAVCWRSECRNGCYYPDVCSERAGLPTCRRCGRVAKGDEFEASGLCQVCLNGPLPDAATRLDLVRDALISTELAERVVKAVEEADPHWRTNAVTNAIVAFVNDATRLTPPAGGDSR